MVHDIEVLDKPDDNFWTAKAYTIPDNHFANVRPGETGFKLVPINKMLPRSFFTNVRDGTSIKAGSSLLVRGIAFGGGNALRKVQLSLDDGHTWSDTQLGQDYGKYSFRQWHKTVKFGQAGKQMLMVRAVDATGEAQPSTPNWNGAGFMRNIIESVNVTVV
jgi:hypothetical protein